MKKIYLLRFDFSKLFIPIALLIGCNLSVKAQTTFLYTAAVQSYTVPAGVSGLGIDAQGGAGGNGAFGYSRGGYGGRVQASLAVTPGQVINIYVGGQGTSNTGSCCSGTPGGYNGGGNNLYGYGGGGGGASDIRIGGTALTNRVIVAGGGGAAAYNYSGSGIVDRGGAGGGLTGEAGYSNSSNSGSNMAQGGTQSAGGAGSTYSTAGSPGTLGNGGAAGSSTYGGGGGGGYYGGGGGSYTGGGGGSSYTDPSLASNVIHTQGYNTGNGIVIICAAPPAGTVVGANTLCPGTTTTMTDPTGTIGGSWVSSNPAVATVGATTGVVTGISAGTVVISYAVSNSCATGAATMAMTVNPTPPNITGASAVCVSAGQTLSNTTTGGTWSSSNTSFASIGSASGIVTGVAPGTPTITYTAPTGCITTRVETVNALPTLFAVGGGGNYCAGGSGLHITLAGSNSGINYQLFNGATPGTTLSGTGATLDYGLITTGGTYTIVGTNTTTNCFVNMTGSVNITVNPLPVVYNTTGGGPYCSGGPGAHIGVDNSQLGVNYQAFKAGLAIGASVPGTGTALDLGLYTAAGNYTVVATNATTGCTSTMLGTVSVIVNGLPAIYSISGGGAYCTGGAGRHIMLSNSNVGVNYQLYLDGAPVGSPMAGVGASLDFGLQTGAGTYTILATNGTTGCQSNMSGSVTITISSLPAAYTVTGGGDYCAGGTGRVVGLTFSNTGVNYQLFNGGSMVGTAIAGTGSALNFGLQTGAGNYTVVATNTTTTCNNNMTGSATIAINPLPAVYIVTGGGNYCSGGAGVHVGLTNSQSGVNYQLYNGGALVTTNAGTGSLIDFGFQTASGSYTVVAVNATTGCTSNMTGTVNININPLPTIYNVTGGGSYCAGSNGVNVGLAVSDVGISYQLYLGSSPVGSPVAGTGSPISFGLKTAAGTYTVIGINNTTLCTGNMAGTAVITINALPSVYTVTGGGNYCNGGTGVHVMLNGSNGAIDYQLYNAGTTMGTAMAGTGSAIDFGLQTVVGTYTVVATNSVTGCQRTMNGSAAVNTIALPTAFAISSGGNYCTGGTGVHITLASSSTGHSYQLLNGGAAAGSPRAGTGGSLDFGAQTTPGTYTIVAINASTTCQNTMAGAATIGIDPLPNPYAITGGGSFCVGGTGVDVAIANSDFGVNYQLYNGTAPVGTVMAGTGSVLDFGLQTGVGAYHVVATDMTTTCANNMPGTTAVTTVPVPTPFTVLGGGHYCAGGLGVDVSISGSTSGVNYQLYKDGVIVGGPLAGTGFALDFGLQTAAGVYTVVASNAASTCSNNMIASATVVIDPVPAAFTVTGGGSYCTGGAGVPVGLTNTATGINYQLYNGASTLGFATAGTGSAISFGSETAPGIYTVVAIDPSTLCSSNMDSSATVTINPLVTPSVEVASGAGLNVCESTSVIFTAMPVSGGATPSFHWSVNGTAVGIDSLEYVYTPANGDMVCVNMTSTAACVTSTTASNCVNMAVDPNLLPTVTLDANPNDTVCAGTHLVFTALPVHGGTVPTYTWTKNGVPVAATTVAYDLIPANNDVIGVKMMSNYHCRTADSAMYSITMHVNSPVAPSFSVSAHPGTHIVIGQKDTLTVGSLTNGGPAPTYQWYINGVAVAGETTATFVSSDFSDQDSVYCVVTGSGNCGGLPAAQGKTIFVRNNTGIKPVVSGGSDIHVIPNPSNGSFVVKGTLGTSGDQNVSLEVTNMLGQVIYKAAVTARNGAINERIMLDNIADGQYLLNLRSETESAVYHIVIGK